ncbi:hypothetical protein QE422_001224 [Chryseobacterium sp. SORGH_AS 447]|uniref:hypothetical protein n=1 Tax=Chryseobacterium sp. SORGH_AS_0447 TaxID=3041769 RepID=UPI00277FF0AD|nr:hypothetical protein [Chryseobacterium sp. SORGH_AS_0447]MDQ1160856.1 hypothetical protein [Chryseobacterium sp. SORGH_AS_0447]
MLKTIPCISAVLLGLTLFVSCGSAKDVDANLPKDISERPVDESSQKYDQAQLDQLRASIESEVTKEKCTNASAWAFAPMGAKACGGPQLYIAYPKKMETVILERINDYTEKVKAFNQKYGVISDCMMVNPPTGIKCIGGKAELINP